jgi:NAD+ kinase
VLVIYKKSTYEICVLEFSDPKISRLVECGDPSIQWMLDSHQENQLAKQMVEIALRRRGIESHWFHNIQTDTWRESDLVIALGGDGTLLKAASLIPDHTPLMGLHSTPTASIGYLCTARAEEVDTALEKFISGQMPCHPVARIETLINNQALPYLALNDLLFAHPSPAATSKYLISWNDISEEHRSSGIWIASPIGSTAAIQSAGGVSMPISSRQFQFVVREPFTPPSTSPIRISKGLFEPDFQSFHIISLMRKALLFCDGSLNQYTVEYGDHIHFRCSPSPLFLVRSKRM